VLNPSFSFISSIEVTTHQDFQYKKQLIGNTMNKSELIDAIASAADLSKADAGRALKCNHRCYY
jgi:bacterial nucleoid protein HU beta subunit